MADVRTNLTQQVIEEVRNYFKDKAFQSVIPRSVKLSEAPSFGKPAVIYDRHNRGSQAYIDLGKEFLMRFGSDGDRQSLEATRQEEVGALASTGIPAGQEPGAAVPTETTPFVVQEKETPQTISEPPQATEQAQA